MVQPVMTAEHSPPPFKKKKTRLDWGRGGSLRVPPRRSGLSAGQHPNPLHAPGPHERPVKFKLGARSLILHQNSIMMHILKIIFN